MSNTYRDDYTILTIRHVKVQGPLPALLCVVCESRYRLSSVRCICCGAGTRGRARGKRKPTTHDPHQNSSRLLKARMSDNDINLDFC